MTSSELRDRAARYRQLAVNMTDKQAIDALHELARECDAMAAKLEAGEQSSANC
jgi:hypothetical protein